MLFCPCKIHFKINSEKQKLVISRFIFQSKNCNRTLGFGVKVQNSISGQKSKFALHQFKSVHRKYHSIFILKLEWKMTFLNISISIQNWKLKNDKKFLLENWKLKIHFSFFNFWI